MSDAVAAAIFLGTLLLALVGARAPLGDYIARVVMSPKHTRAERLTYRLGGIDAELFG